MSTLNYIITNFIISIYIFTNYFSRTPKYTLIPYCTELQMMQQGQKTKRFHLIALIKQTTCFAFSTPKTFSFTFTSSYLFSMNLMHSFSPFYTQPPTNLVKRHTFFLRIFLFPIFSFNFISGHSKLNSAVCSLSHCSALTYFSR